jgi:hypothetical protein
MRKRHQSRRNLPSAEMLQRSKPLQCSNEFARESGKNMFALHTKLQARKLRDKT